MRRILASAMLVFILAGGIMTFVTSVQAAPHTIHDCENEANEDFNGETGACE